MKKIILISFLYSMMNIAIASNQAITGNTIEAERQKKHLIRGLLMKDNVLSFNEKDPVVISMAIQEAIQTKKYDNQIEVILKGFDRNQEAQDKKIAEDKKAIAANTQKSKDEDIIDSQKKEIKNLQAKVDFLNNEVIRLNEKNNEINNKFSSLEQSLVLIKNQLVEGQKARIAQVAETMNVKVPKNYLNDQPKPNLDNNWSHIKNYQEVKLQIEN